MQLLSQLDPAKVVDDIFRFQAQTGLKELTTSLQRDPGTQDLATLLETESRKICGLPPLTGRHQSKSKQKAAVTHCEIATSPIRHVPVMMEEAAPKAPREDITSPTKNVPVATEVAPIASKGEFISQQISKQQPTLAHQGGSKKRVFSQMVQDSDGDVEMKSATPTVSHMGSKKLKVVAQPPVEPQAVTTMAEHFQQMKLKNEDPKLTYKAIFERQAAAVEPSYMEEFREISSEYLLEKKEDSIEISSNGEFDRADKMATYDEDDTEVLKIEEVRRWREQTQMNSMQAPQSVLEDAQRKHDAGVKSQRTKGLKHFKEVGYMGRDMKEVPRWAVSYDAIKKVILYQKNKKDWDLEIFGQLKPRHVQENFVLSEVFSKGNDAHSYLDERGSSANWNDQSEWATPHANRSRQINQDLNESRSEQKPVLRPQVGGGAHDTTLGNRRISHITEEALSNQRPSHNNTKTKRPLF